MSNSQFKKAMAKQPFILLHHRGYPCQYMNITAKIAGWSLRKRSASRKPINFPPVRAVTAHALGKNYPPLFHLELDHLPPRILLEAIAEPAVDFPEVHKIDGRVPPSQKHIENVKEHYGNCHCKMDFRETICRDRFDPSFCDPLHA